MPGVVAQIPNEGSKYVPVSTEILMLCASKVVAHFREALCSAIGLDEEDEFRVLYSERELCEGDEAQEVAFKEKLESGKPCVVRVLYRLLGGKGGFGALLRKQANKGKKTKNFDAMRDLTGRRLRHSMAVDRIKEWMEKQNKEDELVDMIAGSGPEMPKAPSKAETLDPEFVKKLKRSSADRPGVVTAGLRALDALEGEETAKRPRPDAFCAKSQASTSSARGSLNAAALDALAEISGSSEEASPSGEEADDAGAQGAQCSSAAASTATIAPEEKEQVASTAAPAAEPTAAAAVAAPAAPVSSASAYAEAAEALAASFCAAEDQVSKKQVVREAPLSESEAAACLGPEDLQGFRDAAKLEATVSAETLKQSLQKLGLKCGGTPKDRAERLFQLKFTKLEDLPKKEFAKK